MAYVSHARTPEELRKEFVSDIERRIDNVEKQKEAFAKGAEAKARFDAKILELRDQLIYWSTIELIPASGKRKPT